MITYLEASAVVERYLRQMATSYGSELAITPGQTMEFPWGWVFFYNSKRFLESGDYKQMLAGNSPLIVDRDTGELHETGTAEPIEWYIEKYTAARKSV